MQISIKHIIFISTAVFTLYACQQERKAENPPETVEKQMTVNLAKTRYMIGDSIGLTFAQPVTGFDIQLVAAADQLIKTSFDSFVVISKQAKTGWHQLVVKGKRKDNSDFNDTLRVELVSDLVPREMKYTVLSSYPHQKTSFTEGLEFYQNDLYEGTGENGKSQLLKLDLKTGATIKSLDLDPKYFGEGITIVNDKIYQLTWQSGVCFRYNMDFTLDKTFTYYFQGWGLTHNDTTLMMSDGSNKIHFYNTEFEKTGDLEVYDQSGPVRNINELEYLDGFIYANIFETTKIIKIDASTGKVVGFMDMQTIIPAEIDSKKDVLNGIAYHAGDQSFYITGKNWPVMFKIKMNASRIL